MRAGVTISFLLHLALALLVVFGLPNLFAPEEFEVAIPVQIVNISDRTMQTEAPSPAPPQPEPPKPEPPKPAEPQPPPPAPEPPRPEPPAPEPPRPEPAPTPPPPAPEPEPVPEPVIAPPEPEPIPEPEPEPEVEEARPEPPPPTPPKKPEPPKPQVAEKPKEEPTPEPESDITSVLKNVEKLKEKPADQTAEPADQPVPQTASQAPLGDELSTSERDAIASQIQQCWIVDVGMRGIEDIVVALNVQYNPDGSVYRIDYADPLTIMADQRYQVLAERARAAVQECSPIRVTSNYNSWKSITFRFNPRGMLGL